jgi:DNA-binding IclR family transcriptional regulator
MPRHRAINDDRTFLDLRPPAQVADPLVKSAERVIKILELFSDLRAGATVVDIAERLGMPQSSTSALLRSLHALGYLAYDAHDRTYSPTWRVALLGHWIDPQLVRPGPVIEMVNDLIDRTGLDAFLAVRNRLHSQVTYFNYAPLPISYVPPGSGHFLIGCASGHALMCDHSDVEIARLVVATNAQLDPGETPASPRAVIERIAQVRADGYAAGRSARSDARSGDANLTVAVQLPSTLREPMVLALCTRTDTDGSRNPDYWAGIIKQVVSKWLGA